ncbi:MAG: DNA polymerase III subunit gamma/tau [Gemmatimonadota bacterium]
MALALARKYRPKTFADVAVQGHVAATLKGAIARNRVAHGYLLCGPRGVGKTTLARVLAMALNCDRRGDPALGGEPCGECPSCTRIWSGSSSLDVVEIDAASNRGVDDARELRERAMYAPSGDETYKVYIVDEAHMLTREAWNTLLKVLEEPPPRVVFVFATTEPQKIAQAAAPVLSRLQRFDFKRIGPAEIRIRLERVLADEGVTAHPDALAMIARAADGSMRDALSLTDQVLSMGDGDVAPERVRDALGLVPEDEFVALLDLLADRRAGDVFAFVGRLADAGIDFGQFLTGFADMVRAQLAVTLGGVAAETSDRIRDALAARTEVYSAGDLLRMLAALTELEPRFRKSGQQQLLLEALLVRFALLDRTVSLEAMLRHVGGGGTGGALPDEERTPRRSAPPMPAPAPVQAAPATAPAPASTAEKAVPPRPQGDASADWRVAIKDADRPALTVPEAPPAPLRPASPAKPAQAPPGASIPDVSALAERWDEVVSALRSAGKSLAATALAHSTPTSVTAKGEVLISLDEANPIHEQALDSVKGDITVLLNGWYPAIQRVVVRAPASSTTPPTRLTDEMVRSERLTSLRRKDPVLDRAVDVLDLDLAD